MKHFLTYILESDTITQIGVAVGKWKYHCVLLENGEMLRMKYTIGKKISLLLAGSLIGLAFFMITINFAEIYRETNATSQLMLSMGCENQAAALNNQINLVEQAVTNLYSMTERVRPDLETLKDEAAADEYIRVIEEQAAAFAENTHGAMAVYYRLNPDITQNSQAGFFYVINPETGRFEANEITDLNKYDVNDIEHVGWYYIPVWAGEPVWMDPYFNANLGVEMISYVVPIFDGPDLIGVLGMDVDFDVLTDVAEDIHIYESSGAVLCSMADGQVYYKRCDIFGNTIPQDIYSEFQGRETSEKVMNYTMQSGKYFMYFVTLANRMKFLVYAEQSEIFEQMQTAILSSGMIFLLVFGITLMLALEMGHKIVTPIRNITEATKRYAKGDWDAEVTCDTQDELQILAENISIMADCTRDFIEYIQELAKKDGLTGLRNKAAYMHELERLDTEFAASGKPYSVVVFDLNNLKMVNDNFGHEKGDELILGACKIICEYFDHSAVFRIGGDEFVAIIDGDDYENRYEITADFQKYMELSKNSDDVMNVCVASGIADSQPGKTSGDIFKLADQRMYENKSKLKNGAAPR